MGAETKSNRKKERKSFQVVVLGNNIKGNNREKERMIEGRSSLTVWPCAADGRKEKGQVFPLSEKQQIH